MNMFWVPSYTTSGLIVYLVSLKLINHSKLEISKFKLMFKLFRGYFLKTIDPKTKGFKNNPIASKEQTANLVYMRTNFTKGNGIFPSAS